jgi:hypothetical protein
MAFDFVEVRNAMKDTDLDRKILKAMPWLPGLFSKMLRRLKRFDGRQPVTLMAQIENDVGTIVERVNKNPAFMLKAMTALLKHRYFKTRMTKTMQTCIQIVGEQAIADSRAVQLIRLIEAADAKVPYVSWLVLQHHVDLRNQFRPICMVETLLRGARKSAGEAKATLLIDALGKMSELLYHPYLLALWQLTCLERGKWPTTPDFGNLVIELGKRLTNYPDLVNSDARWMRNSARHERWQPIPGEDAIIMWDEHKAPTRFSLDELEANVNEMYQMAAVTFGAVARRYLFQNMLTDTGAWAILGKMLPSAFEAARKDLSNLEAIDEHMESELQPVRDKFAPLGDFILAKCPDARINRVSDGSQ